MKQIMKKLFTQQNEKLLTLLNCIVVSELSLQFFQFLRQLFSPEYIKKERHQETVWVSLSSGSKKPANKSSQLVFVTDAMMTPRRPYTPLLYGRAGGFLGISPPQSIRRKSGLRMQG
jgi:hypothetical protein